MDPHPYFTRQENEIILELTVNVAQAALGDVVSVPTLEGEEQLAIPPGTQSGEVFGSKAVGPVPAAGRPRRRDGRHHRGDPQQLTERQRALLEESGGRWAKRSWASGKWGVPRPRQGSIGPVGEQQEWLEISVEVDGEAAEAVSEVFNRYGTAAG